MPVTVAVVSFNTRELLLRCLTSLAGDVDAGRAEVWVVDNCSSDGSVQAVTENAPWAHVIEAGENVGFGRAVNLVAGRTSGEWILAANADIALEPAALQALLASAQEPAVGCVAPRLLLPDGATQHSVHPFPTVPLTLLFNLGLHHLSAPLGDRLCLEGFWNPDRGRAVPWAIGACLLLRREAFDAVGRFDERQWMYAEDVDLGWRLQQQGWTTLYEPRASVHHESGAATVSVFGDDQRSHFMAATYAMLMRRRGRVRTWATAAINIAGAAARAAWMTALSCGFTRWRPRSAENRRWVKAHWQGVRTLSTGVTAQ
jgi:N-acetylglucosaminyl-diphospho-decaprenol L-rhamnosyltransferase